MMPDKEEKETVTYIFEDEDGPFELVIYKEDLDEMDRLSDTAERKREEARLREERRRG